MKKNTSFLCFLILAVVSAFYFNSCRTVKDIPEDLTAPQLLQRGQSFYDAADYKTAEAYFLATLDRYGDNTDTYIEAKYELAHLYIKTKNYDKARAALEEVLEIYDYAPAGSLPAAYKKLAQIEMEKIPNRSAEE